jgi:hypothetical protein
MKLAGFVNHIKDCTNMFCFKFKNHCRRRTAAPKKNGEKIENFLQ